MQYQLITARQLWNQLNQGASPVIIDTLPPEHYMQRHLPGAVNGCVYEMAFTDQVRSLVEDTTTSVVLYGADYQTMEAICAAEKVNEIGYKNVYVLEGGITAWKEEELELEGTSPAATPPPSELLYLEDGTYTAIPSQSTIHWTGRNHNGQHKGTVELASGSITARDMGISGNFEMDMTSIANADIEDPSLNQMLVTHLMSDDFFLTNRYPTARFRFDRITPQQPMVAGAPTYMLSGLLNLRGTDVSLTVPATMNNLDSGEINLEAHFDLDRTRWGIVYGCGRFFRHLGMHLVYDPISIELRLVLVKMP